MVVAVHIVTACFMCASFHACIGYQQWVFEEAAGLPGLYTIANKYTMDTETVTLYITTDVNPTTRGQVYLLPKISDASGQFSKQQLWRFVPIINVGYSSYVQNYQHSGLVFDIEDYNIEKPVTVFRPLSDSLSQRYAADPTYGPTSSRG